MKLHLVGGFLGSGKTTAIIAAAKLLAEQGERVGVITNDQGRYLVDTAFVRANDIPTVEVSGGCFCCNYDNYREMIHRLDDSTHPSVLFAESVGSCADLVATVLRPSELEEDWPVESFSVFADIRLLRLMIGGSPLPFSDDVVYLFHQQLQEAGLIIVNKADLLPKLDGESVLEGVAARFPGKPIRLQSSFRRAEVADWLRSLDGTRARPIPGLDLDYDTYAAAEARLAWYDGVLLVSQGSDSGTDLARRLLRALRDRILGAGNAIAHVKLFASSGGKSAKLSLTAGGTDEDVGLPELGTGDLRFLINARVECPPEALRELIHSSLSDVFHGGDRSFSIQSEDSIQSGYPKPVHRIL
jgi:Ni2+-binding GTPase involved in maturation of urease and hydrogenase